jgi:hypothetical protein
MLNVGAQKLQHRISQLTDNELWRMVNVDAAQYREEALGVAKEEIARRGEAFQPLIEAQEVTAKAAEPEVYSEEEQIRINEETWDKDSKPIHTIGISLACWLTYLYFAVTEPDRIWVAPVIALGVCAGLDVLRAASAKEHTNTRWQQTFKSAVTISLLSVGVAILAHLVFLLLGASWYELMK